MPRLRLAAICTLGILTLAGCGGTKKQSSSQSVPTAHPQVIEPMAGSPGTAAAEPAKAPEPSLTEVKKALQQALHPKSGQSQNCQSVVYVAPTTSCALGLTVYSAYSRALNYDATNVPGSVTAVSSATHVTYTLKCFEGAARAVVCIGDNNALVSFQKPGACGFDHLAYGRCATAADPYCGMGACFYNAGSSHSCIAGYVYEPPSFPGVTTPGICTKMGAARFAPAAASAMGRPCPRQRISNQGYPVSVWAISVEETNCAAADKALASAIVWRYATPAWNLGKDGVPTRWAPPGWRRCTVLGLWVNSRHWSDADVRGSTNRCTGSGGQILRFSWLHTGPWWVNEVGCRQSCPVTRT